MHASIMVRAVLVHDKKPPVVTSIVIPSSAPTEIRITFNENLDAASVPSAGSFAIVNSGGSDVASSVSINGKVLTVVKSRTTLDSDAVTLEYTQPGSSRIQDRSGNQLASFSATAVTNLVGVGGPVVLVSQGGGGGAGPYAEPAGTEATDIYVLCVGWGDEATYREASLPAGWTRVGQIVHSSNRAGTEVWWRVRGASPIGDTSITWPLGNPNWLAGVTIYAFRGAGGVELGSTGTNDFEPDSMVVPSATVANNDSYAVLSVGSYNDAGSAASSSGLTWTPATINSDVLEFSSFYGACNAGPTGDVTVTGSDDHVDVALLVVVTPG